MVNVGDHQMVIPFEADVTIFLLGTSKKTSKSTADRQLVDLIVRCRPVGRA